MIKTIDYLPRTSAAIQTFYDFYDSYNRWPQPYHKPSKSMYLLPLILAFDIICLLLRWARNLMYYLQLTVMKVLIRVWPKVD